MLLLLLQFFAQIVDCPIELDLKPEEPRWDQTTNEYRKRHFGVIEKWSTKLGKVLHGSTKRRKKMIEVEKFPLINCRKIQEILWSIIKRFKVTQS